MIVETPDQMVKRHSIAVQGLLRLQRLGVPKLQVLPPFIGLTGGQVITALTEARTDLDERYVLAAFTTVEANFKSDMRWRIHKGKKNRRETKALRALKTGVRWNRVSLERLLRCWRDLAEDKRPFSELIRIGHRRHWLAHGKYFDDKSGIGEIEPSDVAHWFELASQAAQHVAADFPRDDMQI